MFFIVSFAHIFGIFIFCSLKHGYYATLNQIIEEGEAHVQRMHMKKVFPTAAGPGVAEITPEVDESGLRATRSHQTQEVPPRGVTELWCDIIRGLPRYICGGAWSGMNLHQKIDFLFICLAISSYIIFSFISLYVLETATG